MGGPRPAVPMRARRVAVRGAGAGRRSNWKALGAMLSGKPQLGYVPQADIDQGWISIQIQSWISSCPSWRDLPSPP